MWLEKGVLHVRVQWGIQGELHEGSLQSTGAWLQGRMDGADGSGWLTTKPDLFSIFVLNSPLTGA